MVLDKITRVYLDPVEEFDDIIKFQKDDRWRRVSVNTIMVTFERTEYDNSTTVDELLKKEVYHGYL